MGNRTIERKLIVGLGNPGKEYENTYHNIGAIAVLSIAQAINRENPEDSGWKRHKKLFEYAVINHGASDTKDGERIFIVPLTFMNESGAAVSEAMKKFGIGGDGLFVIHDESDMPVGSWKISEDRGAAGHKGVQSIIDNIGSKKFLRIRIGIRNPAEKQRKKAEEFVLSQISAKDKKILEGVFEEIARAIATV